MKIIKCLFFFFLFAVITIQASENNCKSIVDVDTIASSKWHPKSIYIFQQDITLKFTLPFEKDQSGVSNLFFISKDSGDIFFLDTVRDNVRHYSWLFPGCYDLILLYNNGKYIKYDNFSFEKNQNAEINMESLIIQSSDSKSQKWLTYRTYNSVVGNRREVVSEKTNNRISGYIFDEKGNVIVGASIIIKDTNKGVVSNIDGYFEINIDGNIDPILCINFYGSKPREISLTANSGLFVVMERDPEVENIVVGSTPPPL